MVSLFAFGLPSGGEWFYILIIALIVFGPKKLPELARGLGRSLGEFKKAKEEFERELHASAEEPKITPPQNSGTLNVPLPYPDEPTLLPPPHAEESIPTVKAIPAEHTVSKQRDPHDAGSQAS